MTNNELCREYRKRHGKAIVFDTKKLEGCPSNFLVSKVELQTFKNA
jgi:hypothetical protein